MKNALATKIRTNLRRPLLALLLGLLVTVAGCSLLVTSGQQRQIQQLATIMQKTSNELEIGRQVQKIVKQAQKIKNQTDKQQYIAQNVIKVVQPTKEEKQHPYGSLILIICCVFAVLEVIFVTICALKKQFSKSV